MEQKQFFEIQVDEEVMGKLKERAEPFIDTPNSVLRRLFDLDKKVGRSGSNSRDTLRRFQRSAVRSYTYGAIKGFRFKGKEYPVKTWKEFLLVLSEEIWKTHSQGFSKVLSLHGRKRVYFSKDESVLHTPRRISGTEYFVETNLSAMNIWKVCSELVALFGYSESDLEPVLK